ncbi:ABC transporter permease subunit [Anaerocolumna sedimenticola]|uniref:ABC transporter permease subunit n=1 Tax=Anaerocolumna sedimenticola TaxID=2696063 RepID=A0A6P1THK0_9FIRM|nr:carbohydrate ABC transporter permease [Anaerocolumna sedimenticola]QHQ59777.1 ABC transporter permease subunit [Anaerocolumna sedimenticola]
MQKKRRTIKNELSVPQKTVAGILLFIIFMLMIIPMWNAFVVSTSTALSSTQSGVKLWWDDFSLEGYQYVYKVTKLFQPFLNSFFVTTVGVISQVVLSAFAGYVLIQKDLPFKKFITSFIMLTMMIPGDLTLISIYQMNKQLNLLNSYMGLIVNGLISGFSILLMRNYFTSVPYSLAESGRIDGASELRIFAGIYLPISKPGLATVFFMEYVAKWNSIMLPATLITDQNKYTLPLMLKAMIMQDNSTSGTALAPENAVMATIIISTIPLLLIYIFAQQYLLAGMNLGASKE